MSPGDDGRWRTEGKDHLRTSNMVRKEELLGVKCENRSEGGEKGKE